MHDVIVVGGGPAGSYAAGKLAQSGHDVLLLEHKPSIGEKSSCTGIIGTECLQSFSIPETTVIRRLNSASLFPPSGNMLRLERVESQAVVIDRKLFDTAISARAQQHGAKFQLSTLVSDILLGENEIEVRATHLGKRTSLKARAVVLANGFSLRLSEKLGLGKVWDFAAGAQAIVETSGLDEVEVYFGQDTAPGFFGWAVPTRPRTARVGLLSRKHPGQYLQKFISMLAAQGKISSTTNGFSYGGIPLKPLPKTYANRLLVIGDPAGQVKPTTGGGIYYGLICSDIAAGVLADALKDDNLSTKRLMNYERLWKKRLAEELKIDYWARKLYESMDDYKIDRVFRTVREHGIEKTLLAEKDLSFDWHSKAILRFMGFGIISRTMNVVKLPFRA